MNKSRIFLWFLVVFILTVLESKSFAQSCSLTVNGTVNWSTAGWSCSGGASAPTTDGGVFNGDLFVTFNNSSKLEMDISLTLNGDLNIITNGSSEFHVDSNKTLDINGDFDAADENNFTITVDGTMQVDGLMEVKNSNAFGGSGTISGDSLIVKNNNGCSPGGCPSLSFPYCSDGNNNFCANNVSSTALPLHIGPLHYNPELKELEWHVYSSSTIEICEVEHSNTGYNWTFYKAVETVNWDKLYSVGVNDRAGFYRVYMENYEGDRTYSNVIQAVDKSAADSYTQDNIIALTSSNNLWVVQNELNERIELTFIDLTGEQLGREILDADESYTLDGFMTRIVIVQYHKVKTPDLLYRKLLPAQ